MAKRKATPTPSSASPRNKSWTRPLEPTELRFKKPWHRDAYKEIVREWDGCTRCPLLRCRRTRIVHLRGYVPAEVLFIGEAPGHSEDLVGIPFIGDAGRLLNKILAAVQDRLDDGCALPTYAITNTVACLPERLEPTDVDPDHWVLRPPSADEQAQCHPRLLSILELVEPKALFALGDSAAKALKSKQVASIVNGLNLPTYKVWHPSYVLRQGGEGSMEFKKLTLQLVQFFTTKPWRHRP